MSGSQGSRGVALLARFAASGVASTAVSAAGTGLPCSGGLLSSSAAPGASSLRALVREAAAHAVWGRQLSTAAAAGAAGAVASSAGAAKRCTGMLLSTGILSRGLATAAEAGASSAAGRGLLAGTRAGATGAASAGASAPSRCSSLPSRLLLLPSRLKSTAAAVAEEAAAAAAATSSSAAAATATATASAYGGAALSAGLSDGARRALAAWLGLCAGWVYSMVVLGGITRLTRSGLSMTEWKLTGERPPMTQADWEAEFTKYKASPEYKKVHRSMSLDEFKFIYWMEYAHRMWGRFLGLAFALPATYFAARRWINGPLARRLGLLFFMGGTQGFVGWWMVRSGLEEPEHEWAQPRVSPYRLAAHLVSAFAIYATLTWTTLDLMYPRPATAGAPQSLLRSTAGARGRLLPLAALIAVTATSGAFVAGMDAGHAYNTWPLMAGQLVPVEDYCDWERLGLTPVRNLFENTAAVQFNHRTLATVTLFSVIAAWAAYKRPGLLPPRATTCLHAVAAVTAVQFALGVWTLLEYVPVPLGSAHQANALNLFTAALALLHACRPPAPGGVLGPALAPLVTPAAVAAVGAVGYAVISSNGAVTASERYMGPSNARGGGGGAAGSK
ncbi:hypothetical protein HYH02_008322 [Chlamydomonas schloesseri]|uniref:Uncharacterized protein n=1 Tax=Chlamydomonas schloesseri TaxID=2026947 RepID=A0A835WGJ6_9CHLO|nr:hypothetical protein HYH02_008322 [Chlamydomonas schloesseri]|eukprot:KAG2446761.1 hypothetical protein HYH02_008322 [Chlamydomonas schloesseri]